MNPIRRRFVSIAALVLACATALSLVAGVGGAAAKGKKKRSGKPAVVSGPAGAIPNGPADWGFAAPLTNPVPFLGTVTVGKKFKGKTVADVDVTLSLAGTPVSGAQCGAICEVTALLTAPNGANTTLALAGGANFSGGTGGLTGNLVSNLTLSDQTPTRTCGGPNGPAPPPPCGDPDATLVAPYTGTAQPTGQLNVLNGSSVKGTWTLTVWDLCGRAAGCGFFGPDQGTSSVTAWSLTIIPAKPLR
jgi:hypothetical protein